MINIMIVDDHKMFREGIRNILQSTNDFVVVADVGNGIDCMSLLKTYSTDLVLLDVDMPQMNGFDTLKSINRKKVHRPKVLMVTSHNELDYLIEAYDNGVDGYITKSCDSKELIRAIHIVMNGEKYVQPSLIPLLNSKLISNHLEKDKVNLLSDREIDILRLIALGNQNKDVGLKLNIKERTVKNHLTRIYKKINCIDRTQAAVFCIRNGIITVQD